MVVNEELKNQILQGNILNPSELHGFSVVLDGNKIWKNGSGVFIFPTRKQAMTAFYNTMKWKVARLAGIASGVLSDYGYPVYDYSRETWGSFKRACHFEIKEV